MLKKLLVFYSFFDSIDFGNFKGDFFIDGILDKEARNIIPRLIKPFCSNNPKFIKKGDQKMEIINFADRIAYQFLKEFELMGMKCFNDSNSLISKNWEKQIYPKFDHKFEIFLSELGFDLE